MISYKIHNQNGEEVGQTELSEAVFGVSPNKSLVHQALVAQMSNERKVLAHTKDRSEVRGGGKKPWKQKGTGRARAGSSRSPIWIGGGVTFGPTNQRSFGKDLNLKMKRKALKIVLSDKVINKKLVILDDLKIEEFKTKIFKGIIDKVRANALEENQGKILMIDSSAEMTVKNSARNLPDVKMINVDNLNIVDVLHYPNLFLTDRALKIIEERYQKQ
ncbi:MAG: 50S ribosomal protein L4 [Patescibacteria group bacterium]|nr:MAG: 50S ribosomal protein L4 [Patescibacteria group bacterium]